MTEQKLNIKKVLIAGGVLILSIILIIFSINKAIKTKKLKATYEYRLEEKGYTNEEIKLFKSRLSNGELDIILEKEYNKMYSSILNNQYSNFSKMNRYIDLINNGTDINKAISIVNVNADKEWYEGIINTDTSKNELMLVNKFNKLTQDYKPETEKISSRYAYDNISIIKTVIPAIEGLIDSAKKDNFNFIVSAGYRSYDEQENIYNSIRLNSGDEEADERAARPGHSEYQTGYCLDIEPYGKVEGEYKNSPEFKWLQENAHRYGFILRYEEGKEDITGFNSNLYRYRFVGVTAATEIHNNNLTFDEYYMYNIK